MIEVHPPEHGIHGVRDFLIHLFTITVGLLIALSLESAVEWRHHVHIRHEAETNMRREIESNRSDVHNAMAAIPNEIKNLRAIQAFLQARIDGKAPPDHALSIGVTQATLQDASWNTASVTTALSFMDYSEVQRFSSAYQLQRKFEAMQDQALPPIVGILAAMETGDPEAMSPADAALAMHDVKLTMANLIAIQGLGVDVDTLYRDALKPE